MEHETNVKWSEQSIWFVGFRCIFLQFFFEPEELHPMSQIEKKMSDTLALYPTKIFYFGNCPDSNISIYCNGDNCQMQKHFVCIGSQLYNFVFTKKT